MNVLSRIEKLEESTGINKPCEVCEVIDSASARVVELMERAGIPLPKEAEAGDRMTTSCAWCLRSVTMNVRQFSISERVLLERLDAAYDYGQLCAPENKTLCEEVAAIREEDNRKAYGEHYGAFMGITEELNRKIEEISRRRAPRKRYICRVPGCSCEYPKSEDEWLRNVRARGIAA